MSALVPFPARIRFVNPDGTLTPEALRLLETLRDRVGGTLGDMGADVFAPLLPDAPIAPDLMQPLPASEPACEVLMQATPADTVPADIVQQPLDYSPGTGLTLTNYRFALTDMTLDPATYGDANKVPRITVDKQGRITAIENVPIAGPTGANYSGSLTGKTVVISNGIITSVT